MNEKIIHRTIALINLVFLTLIAYWGVGLFYRTISLNTRITGTIAESEMSSHSEDQLSIQPEEHYKVIVERDLFRTEKAETTATSSEEKLNSLENLEETQLKLKLWGTVSGDPQKAYAVIEDPKERQQNLYRVGDAIQQATIKMILREKVVITVDGQDEILSMEDMATGKGGRPSGNGSPPPSADQASSPPPIRKQRVTLNRSMIEEAMADVTKLMTEIAITPHMQDGKASGLALSNIKPNSIFRRMGLRNGDVLVGVNGDEITSVDDALGFYESLKSASDVSLKLNRRGQERELEYNIR